MSVSLQKGQRFGLSAEVKDLSKVIVGLGWDEVEQKRGLFGFAPQPIDCDVSVIMLQDGYLRAQEDLVYYGNLKHPSDSVLHMGDNLTGEGEGDDEQIEINLRLVPQRYDRLVIVANIYDAQKRDQHFGMIKNAFIRLVDARDMREICRFDLTEDYSGMTAIIMGEVYRHQGAWKFNAVGQGTNDPNLTALCSRYLPKRP